LCLCALTDAVRGFIKLCNDLHTGIGCVCWWYQVTDHSRSGHLGSGRSVFWQKQEQVRSVSRFCLNLATQGHYCLFYVPSICFIFYCLPEL